jgi:hypothetical protein
MLKWKNDSNRETNSPAIVVFPELDTPFSKMINPWVMSLDRASHQIQCSNYTQE